jgi:oligopeptidase B
VDPYYWMRERDDPRVRAHLEAENAYTERVLAHTAGLREQLFREITGRIKPDDASVPWRYDGYFYYQRYAGGGEYPIFCRRAGSLEAPEEVLLDANELAHGHGYFAIQGVQVSSTRDVVAYAVDTVGRRIYTIQFRNLRTGERLPETLAGVTGNLAWAEDGRTLFYTRQDAATLRWNRLFRHRLGDPPDADVLVYEERDEEFGIHVSKTRSRRFILLVSFQTLSTEVRYLPANEPEGRFTVVVAREPDHEYSLDHRGEHFYIRTNWQARNFRLVRAPIGSHDRADWTDVVPHRPDVLFEDSELFHDHLVVAERRDGLIRLRVLSELDAAEREIDFAEPAYQAWIDVNPELDSTVLRFGYTSLTTPRTIYEQDLATGERRLLKRQEVLGGFDPADYATEREWATARDGRRVPISIVYRRPFARDGSRPLLLHGYGAYGASLDPAFRSDLLSLLDRGFVYAIGHVRGGEELGREWYDGGKLLHKMNTFTDFVDCAEHLVRQRFADPRRLFASGSSAGGLLVGAVLNLRPELWRAAVASVPFVDVVTTMLDESIPLTTSEYDEWGDPRLVEHHDYMLSYSPYDNVRAQRYPSLLVLTGIHDSQVQFWEPAKWVAKLRAMGTGGGVALLWTNLDAGHGGASGRFRRHRETALEYAFLLDLALPREAPDA